MVLSSSDDEPNIYTTVANPQTSEMDAPSTNSIKMSDSEAYIRSQLDLLLVAHLELVKSRITTVQM
jgi:hypothetical protein